MAKAKTPAQLMTHIRFLKKQVATAEKNLKKARAVKKKKVVKKKTVAKKRPTRRKKR